MSKSNITGILFLFVFASLIIVSNPKNLAVAAEPSKLGIYVGPTTVPADNNVYECIFVQLQDSNSRPARAIEDTTVSLSSSLTSIGDVDPAITIKEGSTYATARFYSTFTPGTTTIAATASGYGTVQKNLVTTAPVPSRVAIYGFPNVLPADGSPHDALVVQLQDLGGSPAKAPMQGVTVTLTSSNSTIVSVAASATISSGQTYTLASISGNAVGSAIITAMTSGYSSATTSITTQQLSTTQPKTLRICIAPPKTLADNTARPQIAVELLNAAGVITQQPQTPLTIHLTSSNENVGTVQSTLEIPAGRAYAIATFFATYKAGVATITAAATDLVTDTKSITTIGPVPTKLGVLCNPSALPADAQTHDAIQVQLQDASGKPALDPNGDVTVSLFSSDPTIGTAPTTLTIPYGKSYATATFKPTYVAGSVSITAQASGYTTGQGQIRTYMIDHCSFTVTVTSNPNIVGSGKQANITACVADPGGTPVSDATVKFTSSSGGTFSAVKPLGNGYYLVVFTAPNLDGMRYSTMTATVSKTDYATSAADTEIILATLGTLRICVKDDVGQPVDNATVATSSQPSGMTTLTNMTNSTGYVTFFDAPEGNYTFSVNKGGYLPNNATFNFKTNSPPMTIILTRIDDSQATADDQPAVDLTFVWLILIAVIVAVVIAIVAVKQRQRNQLPERAPFNVNF